MIDVINLKASVNLLALIGPDTTLKRVARTGGGEYADPCPFCGGRDRFRVQPHHKPPRWLCRSCTDAGWQDAITYLIRRDGLDFKTACQRLAGLAGHTGQETIGLKYFSHDAPPGLDWQLRGQQVVQTCQAALWAPVGARARAWLHRRGLQPDTLKQFQLGYNPTPQTLAGHYLPRGIVIPHQQLSTGTLWAIKLRLPAGPGRRKYTAVKGSRQNLFNADSLAGKRAAFVCEGELDTMLLWQEAGHLVGVVTLGSATATLGPRWLPLLLSVERFYLALDNDQAGRQARARWQTLVGSRGGPLDLPAGKDITELWQSGRDLRQWVTHLLPQSDWPRVIIWPAAAPLATVGGQWRRLSNGQIEASYNNAEELALCLELMEMMQ